MELPEDKGTYILIVSVAQLKRLKVGRLGTFDISHLFYAKRQPSFRWFEDQIRIGFKAEVRPQRVVLTARQAE